MSKTIEEILLPKPEARPRIYAYAIADKAHAGLLKVGQTTREVKQRVAASVAPLTNARAKGPVPCQPGATPQVSDHQMKQGLKARPTGCPALHEMGRAFSPYYSFVHLFPGRCPGLVSGRAVGAKTTRDVRQRVAGLLKTGDE